MKQLITATLILLLVACASAPEATPTPTKPSVAFIDLTGFDRELNQSLKAKLPTVDVPFTANTSATAIPQRVQQWLHAVEKGGGQVKVTPPSSTVTAKNPLLLLSLVSGVWNSIKVAKALEDYELHKSAQSYDAEIVLKISDQGDRLVDKILFTEKKPKP